MGTGGLHCVDGAPRAHTWGPHCPPLHSLALCERSHDPSGGFSKIENRKTKTSNINIHPISYIHALLLLPPPTYTSVPTMMRLRSQCACRNQIHVCGFPRITCLHPHCLGSGQCPLSTGLGPNAHTQPLSGSLLPTLSVHCHLVGAESPTLALSG